MTIDYSIKVTQCEPMPGYKLKVTCSDGATGIFDMSHTSTAACSNRSRTRRRSTACDSRSACPHGPETSTSPRNASAPTCKSSRNPHTPAPTVTKTAGAFSCPYA